MKIQIFTSCILEFVFSDCLLQETIIDNCDKLVSVESILETLNTVWNGDHAMKFFIFLKRVLKDLKIFINEEYYCQMRRIMIGKL